MEYDKEILDKTGIFVFKNAVSNDLCDKTIEHFYANKDKQFKGLTGAGYAPDLKNTVDFYVTNNHYTNIYYSVLNIALSKIKANYIGLKKVNISFTGLQFQKNEKDKGYFKWHSDNDSTGRRVLAPIFYLNDVLEGGATEFMYQKFIMKPERGTLIVFPSTWQYFHRGTIPKSGNKYIITSFGLN